MFTYDNMYYAYLIGLSLFVYSNIIHPLHMLQLNSYMNGRYFKYLSRNKKKIFSLKAIIPVLMFFVPWFFCNCRYMYIASGLVCAAFALIKTKTPPEKKPLVYTPRIKRLMITSALVLILLVLAGSVGNYIYATDVVHSYRDNTFYYAAYIILALFALCPWAVILFSNLINLPLEKLISAGYIRSAKKILKKRPDLRVIGITGSYGKTSAKYILSQLLSQKYNVCITPGSFNTTLGVVRTIRENLKNTDNIFIAEMGAKRKNDIKKIAKIVNPEITMITSIGYQHLETFKTIDNIINTKFEIVRYMKPGGKVFLNGGDEFILKRNITADADFIRQNKTAEFYGTDSKSCSFYADCISYSPEGAEFTLHYKDGGENERQMKIKSPLLGGHNIINIAGAAAAALYMGVSEEDIVYAAANLRGAEHRLQLKAVSSNLTIIDDAYNSNPSGSKYALETLGMFENRKRILVTPGMIELGEREFEENRILGMNAAKNADAVILVGKKITEPIYQGLKDAQYAEENIIIVDSINQAFAKLNEMSINEKCVALLENDLTDDYL